jgi:hypothetical protein
MLQRNQRANLQITLNVAKEWDIAYTRDDEQEHGAGEDDDGEEGRDCESSCDQIIPCEVFPEVVPRRPVISFRQVNGKQSQGVDDLTRTIGKEKTLPT